ncbi:MAG: FkbM family methyltransferase [Nitrospirales bacterium]
MKILIVSPFPPDPAPEANHSLHLSVNLAKVGHTVHTLCKKGSVAASEQGLVVHPVINNWSWSDLPGVAKCLRECRPDVVLLIYLGWTYNHHPMITFLPTICETILPGVPCVTQFENVDIGFPPRSFLTKALRKGLELWAGGKDVHRIFGTLLRDSVRIIALSGPHRARLVNHDSEVEEKSLIVPPPPIIRVCQDPPASARRQARKAIGATENEFVLICWGYIYPGKGIETLLQAFRIVCRRNTTMRLILVGGRLDFPTHPISCGDYFQLVRQLPETLGIAERVIWTGHFNWDSDMGSRYLYAGDACILPFDYGVTLNNSSLAAASTHGLPVIGTQLPVGREEALEHGRNIYLCQPRDPEMLAEAIELICENPDIRERLRKGILKLADDWHQWDRMTQRLVGVLESAISSGGVFTHQKSQSWIETHAAKSFKKEKSMEICPDEYVELQRNDLNPTASEHPQDPNENAPFVSVIVAAYNVEKYLTQCLDSLVNQTLKNIEVIAVNDASTDNTLGIMKDYQARHPTLRVLDCKHNLGLASVRNIGMKVAKGTYIGFVDGDDWADPRMCEVLYQQASDDNSDVLIADARVFYNDSNTFGPFFDQRIRQQLDPRLKSTPFKLARELRILLLEPVAWTKLYNRAFLQKHGLKFEDGMNSYEDMCFHFAVLLNAQSLSYSDAALIYYRQNRPGQISGRTDRRVFEVFAVFDRIHEKLITSNVSKEIWGMVVRVHLRQFGWLIQDRVQARQKREFFALVTKQLQKIPESGFRTFSLQANHRELSTLLCMRRNWFHWYETLSRGYCPLGLRMYTRLSSRPDILRRIYRPSTLKRGVQRVFGLAHRRLASLCQSLAKKSMEWIGIKPHFQGKHHSFNQLTSVKALPPLTQEPLIEVCQVNDQKLFLTRHHNSGLGMAIERMTSDHYLVQTATFREGDTAIDIGAHVGVMSIYLAKRFPFIHVYAIEPDPENYDCLKRNIELNGVMNLTIINKAISGDGRKTILYSSHGDSGWATINTRMTSTHQVLRTAQVDTVTLDQLFREHAISHCRLLKITALGAIQESLQEFTRRGVVDLLCGEVDLADCTQTQLELASWRIARQHFWRTVSRQANKTEYSWLQQTPTRIEEPQTGKDFKPEKVP